MDVIPVIILYYQLVREEALTLLAFGLRPARYHLCCRGISSATRPSQLEKDKMKTKTSSKKLSTPFPIRQSAGRCFPLAATLVAAALIACPPLQTRADPIALSFTDGTPSSQNNVTFGWRFLLQAPVHVFKL